MTCLPLSSGPGCSQTTPCLFPLQAFCSRVGLTPLSESGLCSNSISPERPSRLFYFKEPPPSTPAPSLAQLFYSFLIDCCLTYNQPPALFPIMKPRGPCGGCVPSRKIPSTSFPRREEGGPFVRLSATQLSQGGGLPGLL